MKVFWFDTETTGVNENKHGIVQLAYAVEIDGDMRESGVMYSNPVGVELDPGAAKINGFTKEKIEDFPPEPMFFFELKELLSKYVSPYDRNDKYTAGGFNVELDMRFLRKLWLNNQDPYFGSFFSFGVIDPVQIVRFLQYMGHDFPTGMKLTDLASFLGVRTDNAHDAEADIFMTINVTKKLREMIMEGLSK